MAAFFRPDVKVNSAILVVLVILAILVIVVIIPILVQSYSDLSAVLAILVILCYLHRCPLKGSGCRSISGPSVAVWRWRHM